MALRHTEMARQSLPRDARGRFVAVPRPAPRRGRPGVSVDPLWIVATALLVSIACLDYGAIVKSSELIVAGVVAAAIGLAAMLEADRD
ncbi:MAG: hypothetical protein ACHQEA_02520 [Gaiellales bacterium]